MEKNAKMLKISLSEPIVGDEEQQALCDVIKSGWLAMGERVAAFEDEFAKMHGAKEAVALNSCTAALHLALKIYNIGPGDDVLVPALTFVATVNAILYVGANPVFVDIESINCPHICIDDAAGKLTDKTKAVIVMHYGGYLVDMEQWRTFSDSYGLILIEDAAHAPGIEPVGRLSDASAFSFFSNKNMSTAEGGMLLTRDRSKVNHVRQLRTHGMSTDTLKRYKGYAHTYQVNMLGFNYRMDELRAAIGLVQLAHLKGWNQKRYELSVIYRQLICTYFDEVLIPFNSGHQTAAHLLPVLLPDQVSREKVILFLRNKGIQSSIHYPPIHKFTYYKKNFSGIRLPKTEAFCKRELSLPLHPALSEEDIVSVVTVLKHAIDWSKA